MRLFIDRLRASLAMLAGIGICATAPNALAQGLRGDSAAVAMARAMIDRMGSRDHWTRARVMYVVEEVHRPNSAVPYRSESWRWLQRPEIRYRGVAPVDGRPDEQKERAFHWTASTGWSATGGIARPSTNDELRRWAGAWPRNVYVMYGRLAREDRTLSLATLGPRRFAVSDAATGTQLSEFEVSENGSVVRWSTSGEGEQEEWIYGPLRDFGPIRMPDWGARVSDGYRFYYRSIVLHGSDAVGPAPLSSSPGVVLRGATVIDATGSPPQRNRTLVLHDGRIAAIGGPELSVPQAARVIELNGRFVIPGLCDAHAHFRYGTASLQRFLANGVTCLREMWGNVAEVADWRARIDSGTLAGPRILDVSWGFRDGTAEISPEPIVDSAARAGATFIKVGDQIPRATYNRLLLAAQARGLPVLGHLPWSISAIDAANMGQVSIEHANRLPFDAARGGDSLRAAMERATSRAERFALQGIVGAAFDSARAEHLARALARTGVMFSPTLLSARRLAFRNDSSFDTDPRLRHIPDSVRAQWRRLTDDGRLDETQLATARTMYALQLDLVRMLQRHGVPLLAGSDAGDTWVYDGSSLHDEMIELARAGVSPLVVLQAATRNVARIAGAQEWLGTISVGKAADLVILDADPLADIANVRRIHAVVRGGRLFERRELDAMLR